MNFFKEHKNIILFFLISVLIIAGYLFFVDTSSEEDVISIQSIENDYISDTVNSGIEGEILNLLLRMNSIELNSEIFSNSVFKNMQDNSQEIKQEPVGRENPFYHSI